MSKPKADLLLHPVRLRILTEIVGKTLTPRQLAAALPDIPQASLYRQINTLLEGDILEIAEETPVGGAVERTYRVKQGAERLTDADLQGLSDDDHLRYFVVFTASLIESFSRYIQQRDAEAAEYDGMSYNRAVIYLTSEERARFQQEFMQVLSRVISNPPSPERQRYTLASIVIPDERDPS